MMFSQATVSFYCNFFSNSFVSAYVSTPVLVPRSFEVFGVSAISRYSSGVRLFRDSWGGLQILSGEPIRIINTLLL